MTNCFADDRCKSEVASSVAEAEVESFLKLACHRLRSHFDQLADEGAVVLNCEHRIRGNLARDALREELPA